MALTKRAVLEWLTTSELRSLAGTATIPRRPRDKRAIVDALVADRGLRLADLLGTLSAARLRALNEELGLGKASAGSAQTGDVRPSTRRGRAADPEALIRACFRSIRRLARVRGAPGYWVTDDGRVVSLHRVEPHTLKRYYEPAHGYPTVNLSGNRRVSVARLVLATFVGPPSPRTAVARHRNGDRRDCRIENLEWVPRERLQREVVQPSRRRRVATTAHEEAIARVRRRFPHARDLRSVAGHPSYLVDDEGHVYSPWSRGARRIQTRDPLDALTLTSADGRVEKRTRSVIVATAFHGPPPSSAYVVMHKDGDRTNFRADNLAWRRRSRTIDSAPPATDEEVRAIRFLAERGEPKSRIARAFERSLMSVRSICRRSAYRDVADIGGASPLEALSAERRARLALETRSGAALQPDERLRREIEAVRRLVGEGVRIAPAPGLPAEYYVSELGHVVSLKRWPLRPASLLTSREGFIKVHDGLALQVSVAQLVFEAFLGERPERVRHIDGDPDNNRLSNLARSARAEREEDSWRPAIERIRAKFPSAGVLAPIDGAPLYYVSNDGRVYSALFAAPRELLGTNTPRGRVVTLTSASGERMVRPISRLVARAFVPNPRRYRIVLHRDGDHSNNRAANLFWARGVTRGALTPPSWSDGEALARIRAQYPDAGTIKRVVGVPGYFVCDRGYVYSILSGTPRRLRGDEVEIPGGGLKRTSAPVAQLVAAAFIGRPRGLLTTAGHKNGDKTDNRVVNLFWARRGSGTRLRSRKLDTDTVRAVRLLVRAGARPDQLARSLGVSDSMARLVARGKSYRDVTDGPIDPTRLPDDLRRLLAKAPPPRARGERSSVSS